MRKPDFFFIGAAKCGTTALHGYLSQHPDIFLPPEEVHFFGSDFNPRIPFWIPKPSEEEYRATFGTRTEQSLGERSAAYIYSVRAAAEIKAYAPEARIIATLRNPIDMIYSLHNQFLHNGFEDVVDFEEALAVEATRRRGLLVKQNGDLVGSDLYRGIARFSEQMQRYYDVFDRARIHITIFDDFKDDTPGAYREVLRFLGVDDSFEPDFKIVNAYKGPRYKFFKDPPPALRGMVRAVMPKPLRSKLWSNMSRLNTKPVARTKMTPEVRHRLQIEFRPEAERLSKLLGRDLTHWVTGAE